MSRLTIIVPCHNVVHKLNALDALRRITDERLDIIFVDDGSTDGTAELLDGLDLPVGKTVLRSANRGPGAARNIGLGASKADYVWFVDADDRIIPAPVVAQLSDILRLGPDVAIFQGMSRGERLPSTWSEFSDMHERFVNYGRLTTKLFKREFLEQHSIGFPDSYACEDNAFLLEAAELQSSTLVDEAIIYEVVPTEDSITRGSFNAAYLSRWLAVKQMLDFARAHPRQGLRRLERELVFLSLSLSWSYYVERGKTADILRLLPRLLAKLRAWKLLGHLDVFLNAGSITNRAVKLAAISAALPLSLLLGSAER